jgi:hypothetical protein
MRPLAKRRIERSHQSHGDWRMNDARRTASQILDYDERRVISSICYGRTYNREEEQEIVCLQIRTVSEGRLERYRQIMGAEFPLALNMGSADPELRRRRLEAAERALGIMFSPLNVTAAGMNMIVADIRDPVLPLPGVIWAVDETGGYDAAIPRRPGNRGSNGSDAA